MKFPLFFTVIISLVFSFSNLFAQMSDGNFGNEWIRYNQSYYKIQVLEEGVFAIEKAVLNQTIPNFNQVNVQDLQLFYMGVEIPIHVETTNGAIDRILFYAEKKEGLLDRHLYRQQQQHFNPNYSIVSDTATYFLTWNTATHHKRLEESSPIFNSQIPKESYFMHTSEVAFNDTWNQGKYRVYSGSYILSKGEFEYGEGFGSAFTKHQDVEITTPHVYSNGPQATINVTAYSNDFGNHAPVLSIGNATHPFITYQGDSVLNLTMTCSPTILDSSNIVTLQGTISPLDKYSVSVANISYPRAFNFGGSSCFKFEMPSSNTTQYLEIANFKGSNHLSSNNQSIFLYDLTNNLRIQSYWDGEHVHIMLPASASKRTLVLVNEQETKTIHTIQATHFQNYRVASGDYVIITHPSLFSDGAGNNPILDYAYYRAQTGFAPVIVTVDQLYDQFAYGVCNHPLAIRNFSHFIKQHWNTFKPEYIFIIGKGLTYNQIRTTPSNQHLVPSFGYPASDNLLLGSDHSDKPCIPVGRLAATTGEQVMTYLNKIKTLEQTAKDSLQYHHQAWRKQIIHLGGGTSNIEQNALKNHLLYLQPLMEKGSMGAKTHSFFKNQEELINIPNSIMIDSLVNDGVALITFFGHGSTNGFDYYLNTPNNYKNTGKYPFVLALGCYNGTIYEQTPLISEKFIFEASAGASGYISFVDAVTISSAALISDFLYTHANNDLYGAGIGKLLQETIDDLTTTNSYPHSPPHQMGCQYLVYHGDPAVKLSYRTSPDFYIDESFVSTIPKKVDNYQRNFRLVLDIQNLGKHVDTLLPIKIIRQHPSGKVDSMTRVIRIQEHQTTVDIVYPINGYEDFGQNRFSVYLDYDNQYVELPNPKAEENNSVIDYVVMIGNPVASPIYPKKYGIVNNSSVTLKAMTTNAFDNNQTWFIEIDTTRSFSSPMYESTSISNSNNLVKWSPNVVLSPNVVYYWRVQILDANLQYSEWSESSFIYLPNQPADGWNQSHVEQHIDNHFEGLNLSLTNDLNFEKTLYEISAKGGYIPHGIHPENLALYQNGSKIDKCRCSHYNGVYVAVFNPATKSFWTLPGGSTQHGAVNCDPANRTAHAFLFPTQLQSGQDSLFNFVMNVIPDGHLVLLYTLNNSFASAWSDTFIQFLKAHGATKVDALLHATDPSYSIGFEKGAPYTEFFSENLSLDKTTTAEANVAMTMDWHRGTVTSPLIGPANHWKTLKWQTMASNDSYNIDSAYVNIWGVDMDGNNTLLSHHIATDSLDLSFVDAQQYPYLKLTFVTSDMTFKTPAQLDYWRVYADFTSDAALSIPSNYSITYDSSTQAQNLVLDVTVWNMGVSVIDSTHLAFSIAGNDTIQQAVNSILATDSLVVQVNIPLIGLVGQQSLIAKVNPVHNESVLTNNWGWLNFEIPTTPDQPTNNTIIYNDLTEIHSAPNPFTDQTYINFTFEEKEIEQALVEVFNNEGRLLKQQTIAVQQTTAWAWDGTDQTNNLLSSGIYYCRITPLSRESEPFSKAPTLLTKLILAR